MTTTPRIEVPSAGSLARTVAEHKRMVTFVIAGFVAFGLALNAFTPPVYRATVRVEFPAGSERSPWTGQPVTGGSFQSENMALFTSAELITNRVLLSRLATDLSRSEPQLLAQANEEKRRRGGLHWLRVPIARASGTASPAGTAMQLDPVALGARVDRLERAISVQPVADTRLVDIRVEDSDPVMARETADRLARMFVEWQQQRNASADTSGLTFVLAEIAQVRERIERTSAELSRVVAASTRVSHVRTPVARGGSSGTSKDLLKVESELASLRNTYRDGHPRVQALLAEARALRQRAAAEPRGVAYETRAVRTVVPAPRQAVLENELAVDEALYARLMSRAREIGMERQMASPAVAVVEPATVTPDPVRPRPLLNLAVCLLAGTFVALGLALVRGSVRRTIRGVLDAEELTGLPVLAVIPKRA
jgi:uncharacterized protein involved in exopolysaccharide biosynthesis